MSDNLFKAHNLRSAIGYGQHVHTKGILEPCLFIEHVDKVLNICILTKLNDNTDSFLGGLVRNVYNILRFFGFGKSCYIHQELGNVGTDHGIGNFRNNHIGLAGFSLFDVYLATNLDLPDTGFINFQQLILIGNDTSGREIRTFDIFHQSFCGNLFILHVGFYCIGNLTEIVRRNTGCHTNGNSFGTID